MSVLTENFEPRYQAIFKKLSAYGFLSEPEKLILKEAFVPRDYRNGQILQQAGHRPDYMWFIYQGITRSYYTGADQEYTLLFSSENTFVRSTGFVFHSDAQETIVASSILQTLTISYDTLTKLKPASLVIGQMELLIQKQEQYFREERIRSLLADPPVVKIKKFFQAFPQLFNKVPHHHVASYLGMSLRTFDYALAAYNRS